MQCGDIKMGFHSLPSLQQLHLHVISQVTPYAVLYPQHVQFAKALCMAM